MNLAQRPGEKKCEFSQQIAPHAIHMLLDRPRSAQKVGSNSEPMSSSSPALATRVCFIIIEPSQKPYCEREAWKRKTSKYCTVGPGQRKDEKKAEVEGPIRAGLSVAKAEFWGRPQGLQNRNGRTESVGSSLELTNVTTFTLLSISLPSSSPSTSSCLAHTFTFIIRRFISNRLVDAIFPSPLPLSPAFLP